MGFLKCTTFKKKKKKTSFDFTITQLEGFANVFLNKDILEAAIRAWRDLIVTHIDLSNINYRFTTRRFIIVRSYKYLGKKNVSLYRTFLLKKIRVVFPEEEGHNYVLTVMYDFIMLFEICYLLKLRASSFNYFVKT